MAYVNKQNLSDFWSNAKRYIAARDADGCDWTSVPVNAPVYRFEVEPNKPVNPVIEFGFMETPPVEGDKSPSNPSTITGVSSIKVTRCGKNLCPNTNITRNQTGITITNNEDGSLTFNGTVSNNVYFIGTIVSNVFPAYFEEGKTYTVTVYGTSDNISFSFYKYYATNYGNAVFSIKAGKSRTFTMPDTTKIIMRFEIPAGTTISNEKISVQIEEGFTSTSFEPYSATEAVVQFDGTHYGGSIDLATGVMTVTWLKRTVTSVNNFQGDNGTCVKFGDVYTGVNSVHFSGSYTECFICSEFPTFGSSPKNTEFCRAIGIGDSGSQSAVISILKSRLDVSGAADPSSPTNAEWIAAFNVWLASNPITYYYKLYTPFTVQLDPVQLFSALSNSHVNTIFTDTGTITQLTYAKEIPTQEDVFRYANWHRTETAGAVTCYPVPESELHPVVNFSSTETPPASGDKGPDNPSTITGVSSAALYRTSKNIFFCQSATTQTSNGLTLQVDADGTITLSGTATANTFFYISREINLQPLTKAGKTYTLSGCPSGGGQNTYSLVGAYTHNGTTSYIIDRGNGYTFTKNHDALWVMYIYVNSGTVITTPVVFRPQIEIGATATSFEPCSFAKCNINLDGTYYRGSVDLKTGLMTVTRQGYAFSSFDGLSTGWGDDPKVFSVSNLRTSKGVSLSSEVCSHFTTNVLWSSGSAHYYQGATSSYFFNPNWANNQDAIDFFEAEAQAGHPITISYELATPYTVQLTPQQIEALPALDRHEPRINTLYTDADSIQVSYQKSPIQTERELTNAILALGGGE